MSDKQRAAMQKALEALKDYHKADDDRVSVAMSILQEALAERKVLTMTQEEMVDAIRSAKIEQAEQEPVACPDKGLWTVKQWGTDKVVLLSGDFTHDVGLTISGDFLDIEQRLDYALNLATWMNYHLQNAAPVRTKDLTDDEIADIRMSIVAYEPVEWGRVFARAVIAAYKEKNK